jgi:Protein of unknown function (DUF2802)
MADQTFGILEVLLLAARAFGLFAAFAAFAWALMRMRREHLEQIELVLASQRELALQAQSLADRVAALSTLVASSPRRAEPVVEAPPPPPRVHAPRRHHGVPSYETAKRLARSGASVEEIVASCGVAGTEARLLHRLHGADARHDHAA